MVRRLQRRSRCPSSPGMGAPSYRLGVDGPAFVVLAASPRVCRRHRHRGCSRTGRQAAGGGPSVGLIAAGIAAVNAGFWVYEPALTSETLLMSGSCGDDPSGLWYSGRRSVGRAAALGATCGVLATTRSEQVLILPLLVVPLILATKNVDWRARIGWLAIAVASMIVVVAPWTIYNLGRFERPVVLSNGFGGIALAGSCSTTLFWCQSLVLTVLGACSQDRNVTKTRRLRDVQAGHVAGELRPTSPESGPTRPVSAGKGRAFGYWNPFQQTMLDNAPPKFPPVLKTAPTSVWVYDLQLITYWCLLVPAIAGCVIPAPTQGAPLSVARFRGDRGAQCGRYFRRNPIPGRCRGLHRATCSSRH